METCWTETNITTFKIMYLRLLTLKSKNLKELLQRKHMTISVLLNLTANLTVKHYLQVKRDRKYPHRPIKTR